MASGLSPKRLVTDLHTLPWPLTATSAALPAPWHLIDGTIHPYRWHGPPLLMPCFTPICRCTVSPHHRLPNPKTPPSLPLGVRGLGRGTGKKRAQVGFIHPSPTLTLILTLALSQLVGFIHPSPTLTLILALTLSQLVGFIQPSPKPRPKPGVVVAEPTPPLPA